MRTKAEIKRVERIETPLKPEKEKEQRERELPPPEYLTAEPDKENGQDGAKNKEEKGIADSLASTSSAGGKKELSAAQPPKKRKKTLF